MATAQSNSVLLRMNLEEGFEANTKNSLEMKMDMMGQEMNMTMEFGGSVSVIEVETEGNVALSYSFDDIIIEVNADGMEGRYDSRSGESTFPEGAEELTGIGAMFNGIEMNMEYSARGEFVKVLNPEEVVQHMIDGMDMTEEDANFMRSQIQEQVVQGSMSNQLGISSVTYPEHAVSVGDTWTDSQTSSGALPIALDLEYEVREIKEGKVYIDVSGGLSEDGAAPLAAMFNDYKFFGEVIIDQATGWVLKNEITLDTKISDEVEGDTVKDSESMSMTMFMHMVSRSEM